MSTHRTNTLLSSIACVSLFVLGCRADAVTEPEITESETEVELPRATHLAFVTHPTNTNAGAPIGEVMVEIRDANGTLFEAANNPVTIAIAESRCGGILSGTTTVTASGGHATFSDLTIDVATHGYRLVAAAGGLSEAVSDPFDVMKDTSRFPLSLCLADPVGDQTGPVDVVRMFMQFSDVTGDYEILLIAHPENPFAQDSFRVNINLFNRDTGTFDVDPSFFSDVFNDYRLATPVTAIELWGNNGRLRSWKAGDRIYTNSLEGTGNPVGITLYRSAVSGFPMGFLSNEDVIAFAQLSREMVVESWR